MRRGLSMDRLLAEYTQSIDDAFIVLTRRLEVAGALAVPDFATVWSCFAEWFSEPVEGVQPAEDGYEFGAGFIDGDAERAALELDPPASLRPPLVELGLVRSFHVKHPNEPATSLSLGVIGVVWHYPLTDAWRALKHREAQVWANSNPYGWHSHGSRAMLNESLRSTESTNAFRLASDHQPLRTELLTSSREQPVVLGG